MAGFYNIVLHIASTKTKIIIMLNEIQWDYRFCFNCVVEQIGSKEHNCQYYPNKSNNNNNKKQMKQNSLGNLFCTILFAERERGDRDRRDEPDRTDSDWRSKPDPPPDQNGYNDRDRYNDDAGPRDRWGPRGYDSGPRDRSGYRGYDDGPPRDRPGYGRDRGYDDGRDRGYDDGPRGRDYGAQDRRGDDRYGDRDRGKGFGSAWDYGDRDRCGNEL